LDEEAMDSYLERIVVHHSIWGALEWLVLEDDEEGLLDPIRAGDPVN
jgi:hypothetical protein